MAAAVPLPQPPSPPLLPARRPFRPRAGSGVDYFELGVMRPPLPCNAVDIPLTLTCELAPAGAAAHALMSRGHLPVESWRWLGSQLHQTDVAWRRRVCTLVMALAAAMVVGIAVGSGLLALAGQQARAEFRVSHADDDDFDVEDIPAYAPAPYGASLVFFILGPAIFLAGVVACCCRLTADLDRRLEDTMVHVSLHVASASGGRYSVQLVKERMEVYEQAEGRERSVVVVPREYRLLRFEAAGGEPLHSGMCSATHGYLPGLPGCLLGGDCLPVVVPPPPSGYVVVNPYDLMSPSHT